MGNDTSVRAGCSLLIPRSLVPPSRRVGVPLARALARASRARKAERRPRRVQWHRRGRQQRQHGCSGRLLKQLRAELFL